MIYNNSPFNWYVLSYQTWVYPLFKKTIHTVAQLCKRLYVKIQKLCRRQPFMSCQCDEGLLKIAALSIVFCIQEVYLAQVDSLTTLT